MTTFAVSCKDPIYQQLVDERAQFTRGESSYVSCDPKAADVGTGDKYPIAFFEVSPERKIELMQQFVNRECYQHDSTLERVSTRTKTI